MEPLFECTTVQNREVLRMAAARLMRTKLIVHAVILITLALGFLAFVLIRRLEHVYFFATAFSMACIALAIWRFENVPQKFSRKTYEDQVKLYGEPAVTDVCVYESQLRIENRLQRRVKQYDWQDCVKIMETKELFLILTRQKTVVVLDKSGFHHGEPAEFPVFFQSIKHGQKK